MLAVEYFCSNKSSFCVISLRSQGFHEDEVNLAILSSGDATRFETVVCVTAFVSEWSQKCLIAGLILLTVMDEMNSMC